MARLMNVLLMIFIPIILFHIAGLVPNSFIMSDLKFANPEDVTTGTPIFQIVAIIAAGGALVGVVAGAIFGRNLETILFGLGTGAMMGVMLAVIGDYILIYNLVKNEVSPALAMIIFSPLIFAGGIMLIEWIRGTSA